MFIHDEIREGLAGGLTEDALRAVTRLIANYKKNGDVARPIVLHTVLTVLDGTLLRWFADYPTTPALAASLTVKLVPAIQAVLTADEQSSRLLPALDDLVTTYRACIEEFRT